MFETFCTTYSDTRPAPEWNEPTLSKNGEIEPTIDKWARDRKRTPGPTTDYEEAHRQASTNRWTKTLEPADTEKWKKPRRASRPQRFRAKRSDCSKMILNEERSVGELRPWKRGGKLMNEEQLREFIRQDQPTILNSYWQDIHDKLSADLVHPAQTCEVRERNEEKEAELVKKILHFSDTPQEEEDRDEPAPALQEDTEPIDQQEEHHPAPDSDRNEEEEEPNEDRQLDIGDPDDRRRRKDAQMITIRPEFTKKQMIVKLQENVIKEEKKQITTKVQLTENTLKAERTPVETAVNLQENTIQEKRTNVPTEVKLQENVIVAKPSEVPTTVQLRENVIVPERKAVETRVDLQENIVVAKPREVKTEVNLQENDIVEERHRVRTRVDLQENLIIPHRTRVRTRVGLQENVISPEVEPVDTIVTLQENIIVPDPEAIETKVKLQENIIVPDPKEVETKVKLQENVIIPDPKEVETKVKLQENVIIPDRSKVGTRVHLQENMIMPAPREVVTKVKLQENVIRAERKKVATPVELIQNTLKPVYQTQEVVIPITIPTFTVQIEQRERERAEEQTQTDTSDDLLGTPISASDSWPSSPEEYRPEEVPPVDRDPPNPAQPDAAVSENEIIQRLSQVTSANTLRQFIQWLSQAQVNIQDNADRRRMPIVLVMKQRNKYPAIGQFACPKCATTLRSGNSLREHLRSRHGVDMIASNFPWFMHLEEVLGYHLRWSFTHNQEEDWKKIQVCPATGCHYMGMTVGALQSHLAQNHAGMSELAHEIGLLWAALVHSARQGMLITTDGMFGPRQCHRCGICKWFIGKDKVAVSLHTSKVHPRESTEGRRTQSNKGILALKTRTEEDVQEADQGLREDEERKRQAQDVTRQERANPEIEQHEPPAAQMAREQRLDMEREIRENRGQNMRREDHEDSEHIEQEAEQEGPDRTILERRIEQCKQWIEEAEGQEEHGISLPKIWGDKLKKISPKLRHTFEAEIEDIINTFLEDDLTEDPDTKMILLEGSLAKIRLTLRKRIREVLRIPAEVQNHRQNRRLLDNNRPDKRRLTKIVGDLQMLRALHGDTTSTGLNNQARLRERISHQLSKLPEDLIEQFGGADNEAIDGLIQEPDDHFEDRLDYLRAQLATEQEGERPSKGFQNLIRKAYDEDPSRATRWFVLESRSPECPIRVEEFAAHYGARWTTAAVTEPNPDFTPRQSIREEDNRVLTEQLLDEKEIAKTLASRSNLSANGPDAIGYSTWKSGGKTTVKLIRHVLKLMIETGRAPTSFKQAKTTMIFKKGTGEHVKDWRPITITNCLYRIIFCHISRCLMTLDQSVKFTADSQVGFTKTPAGAMRHGVTITELIHDASRSRRNLYLVTIDFEDAFGSVPHDVIARNLEHSGLHQGLTSAILDSYQDSWTRIQAGPSKTDRLFFHRGVKQGCPLSPTLFNLAIDPLIRKLEASNEGYRIADEQIACQAYADDLVLVSDTEEGMHNLLHIVEHFCQATAMTLNVKKCQSMAYLATTQRRMASVPFTLRGESIPCVHPQAQSPYLGIPVGITGRAIKENASQIIEAVTQDCNLICNSSLRFNQMIHAIKHLMLPRLDYILLTSQTPRTRLLAADSHIRGYINRSLQAEGIPEDFFYTDWSDGGLGLYSLAERQQTLTVKIFTQLYDSEHPKTKSIFRHMCVEEAKARQLQDDPESPILQIQLTPNGNIPQGNGTSNLYSRTLRALLKLEVGLKREEDSFTITWRDTEGVEHHEPIGTSILPCLNSILAKRHQHTLEQKPLRGHSFYGLKNSPTSNFWLGTQARTSDSIVRFAIKARTNSIATGQLRSLQRGNNINTQCSLCHQTQTLQHILNGCPRTKNIFTRRHDAVQTEVINLIHKNGVRNVHVNCTVRSKDGRRLPEQVAEHIRNMKPDIWWYDQDTLNIVEITVPYSMMSEHNPREEMEETMITRRREKTEKYEELVNQCRAHFAAQVVFSVIIVSSLGAVPSDTIRDLVQIAKGRARQAQGTAKRLAVVALRESLRIVCSATDGEQEATESDSTSEPDSATPEDRGPENIDVPYWRLIDGGSSDTGPDSEGEIPPQESSQDE